MPGHARAIFAAVTGRRATCIGPGSGPGAAALRSGLARPVRDRGGPAPLRGARRRRERPRPRGGGAGREGACGRLPRAVADGLRARRRPGVPGRSGAAADRRGLRRGAARSRSPARPSRRTGGGSSRRCASTAPGRRSPTARRIPAATRSAASPRATARPSSRSTAGGSGSASARTRGRVEHTAATARLGVDVYVAGSRPRGRTSSRSRTRAAAASPRRAGRPSPSRASPDRPAAATRRPPGRRRSGRRAARWWRAPGAHRARSCERGWTASRPDRLRRAAPEPGPDPCSRRQRIATSTCEVYSSNADTRSVTVIRHVPGMGSVPAAAKRLGFARRTRNAIGAIRGRAARRSP